MRLFDTITRHGEGPRGALPIRISLLHTLAPDETPHLIELHLGHRDILEVERRGMANTVLVPHRAERPPGARWGERPVLS